MKHTPGLPLTDIQMRFRTPGGCPVAQIGVYSFTTSSSDAMPRCILICLLLAVVSPLQTALADAFTESLTPVRKDCELGPADLAQEDLILPGGPGDNSWPIRLQGCSRLVLREACSAGRGRSVGIRMTGCSSPFRTHGIPRA